MHAHANATDKGKLENFKEKELDTQAHNVSFKAVPESDKIVKNFVDIADNLHVPADLEALKQRK